MKKLTLPTILLFTSTIVTQAADNANVQKQLEAYGWIMGKQMIDGSTAQFGFTDAQKAFVIKGVINGVQGIGESPIKNKEDADNLEGILEGMATAQQKNMEIETAKQSSKNKEAGKAFFEKLAKEGKAKKTSSGLYYEIIKEGSKEMPKGTSTVKIDYVGKFIDGTEFDSSKKRGQPATFSLEHVIPGFKEGLQLIGKGGSIRLYVPSELGYGDSNVPNIPAGSTLIFDVDMLDIPVVSEKPAVKPSQAGG